LPKFTQTVSENEKKESLSSGGLWETKGFDDRSDSPRCCRSMSRLCFDQIYNFIKNINVWCTDLVTLNNVESAIGSSSHW